MLGEWLDAKGDGSYRVEWFYMEGAFGMTKADLIQGVRSRPTAPSGQSLPPGSDSNRPEPKEEPSVTGVFRQLPDLGQPSAKTAYVAESILAALGDRHSQPFYRLVAAKVPEDAIRRALAEVKADGAVHPARRPRGCAGL